MDVRKIGHCSHWGAFTVLVQGQKIVGIEPFSEDPSPSRIINSVAGWGDSNKRILRPKIRRGWLQKRWASDGRLRGEDDFVEVSWDEALDLVAEEINRVRHLHGNASIFAGSYGWTSCGRFHHAPTQLKRMLNLVGGYTGHVDTYSIAAGPAMLREALGSDALCKGGATTLDNVAKHTETLIVFGALSPRTAQIEAGGIGAHMLETRIRELKRRGAHVVLISPYRDDIPSWVGAAWHPIRPNTDTALMLAMAGEIVAANAHDAIFLERYCSGAEEFVAYLKGESDGVPKNAEWAEDITGIAAATIRDLASALTSTRSMLSVSWSLQRAHHGEQPFWAALGLAAVVGQIGLPGGGVAFGYGSLGGVGEPLSLARAPAIRVGKMAIDSFIPVARISDLLLRPGEPFEFEGKTHVYPDIRLVYWAGGNPFHHHQDLNRLRRAWAKPETIVVQEIAWTATAARADIVLPATSSLERNDLSATDRSSFIVAMKKAIEPIGSSRNDYDIIRDISGRLGVLDDFSLNRTEMEWLKALYEDTRSDLKNRLQYDIADFETFWDVGYTKVPTRGDYVALGDFRKDPSGSALPTESGKIVLTSQKLKKLRYSDCRSHPAWIEPAEWLDEETLSSPNSFHLISHQPTGRLHSQLESEPLSVSNKVGGIEQVQLHPNDAKRLGVGNGDLVKLWNARGQCLAVAAINDAVCERVAILPTGSWFNPADNSSNPLELSGNPNVLTLDRGSSNLGQGCAAHTCIVNVALVDDRQRHLATSGKKGTIVEKEESYS